MDPNNQDSDTSLQTRPRLAQAMHRTAVSALSRHEAMGKFLFFTLGQHWLPRAPEKSSRNSLTPIPLL